MIQLEQFKLTPQEQQQKLRQVPLEQFKMEQPTQQSTGKINFWERAKLGFGGAESKAKQQQLEKEAGLKGKFDIGDIADVVGSSLPIVGGILEGAGGAIGGIGVGAVPGLAIGSMAGESTKQAMGRALGVREDIPLGKEMGSIAKEGALTYVGGKAIQFVSKAIKPAFSRILGLITSENPSNIKMVLNNPKLADSIYKEGDAALRAMVKEGAGNSVKIRNNFFQGTKEIYDDILGKFKNPITSTKQLKNDFVDVLSSKGVKITKKGFDFSASKINANPGEVSRINNVYDVLSKWKNFTATGTRELRQIIGQYTSFPNVYGMPSKSSVLSQFYHGLNDKISASLPKDYANLFKEVNKTVSSKGDLYSNMVKAFNSGDPFSTLANSLSKNKDTLRQALELYTKESGKKVLPLVAAREISATKPAQFFLNPRAIIDAFYTPRAQLKTVIGIGKASDLIKKIGGSLYGKYQNLLGIQAGTKTIPFISKLLK